MQFIIFILNRDATKKDNTLINYSKYKAWDKQKFGANSNSVQIKNFSILIKKLCHKFELNLLQIHHDGASEFIHYIKDSYIDHFLKIVCVIWVKNSFRIVYYDVPTVESLHLFSLYAHHNFDLHSQVNILTNIRNFKVKNFLEVQFVSLGVVKIARIFCIQIDFSDIFSVYNFSRQKFVVIYAFRLVTK